MTWLVEPRFGRQMFCFTFKYVKNFCQMDWYHALQVYTVVSMASNRIYQKEDDIANLRNTPIHE